MLEQICPLLISPQLSHLYFLKENIGVRLQVFGILFLFLVRKVLAASSEKDSRGGLLGWFPLEQTIPPQPDEACSSAAHHQRGVVRVII